MDKKFLIGSVLILSLLLLMTPFADPNPDGLEIATEEHAPDGVVLDLGILSDYGGEGSLLYELVGRNEAIAVILSGIIGTLLVLSIFVFPLLIMKRQKSAQHQ